VSLSVSIVVYRPELSLLKDTALSLRRALERASADGMIADVTPHLIDNGGDPAGDAGRIVRDALGPRWGATLVIHRGHGNLGYGRGHNLAFGSTAATYHLVLNPDVVLDDAALTNAIRFMESNPDVGMLTPAVTGEAGERQYLCKRHPSLLVLFLRGFAPAAVRARFRPLLDRYEMRDCTGDEVVKDVPIASGCFMLLRHGGRPPVAGFSDRYFLYFEDFDLSLSLGRVSRIAYVPMVKIVHFGGHAARKGLRHNLLFLRSALTFFSRHGWRLI
jgi:GT2 family glycosyltransferase